MERPQTRLKALEAVFEYHRCLLGLKASTPALIERLERNVAAERITLDKLQQAAVEVFPVRKRARDDDKQAENKDLSERFAVLEGKLAAQFCRIALIEGDIQELNQRISNLIDAHNVSLIRLQEEQPEKTALFERVAAHAAHLAELDFSRLESLLNKKFNALESEQANTVVTLGAVRREQQRQRAAPE